MYVHRIKSENTEMLSIKYGEIYFENEFSLKREVSFTNNRAVQHNYSHFKIRRNFKYPETRSS